LKYKVGCCGMDSWDSGYGLVTKLLRIRSWIFGFHKMMGHYWVSGLPKDTLSRTKLIGLRLCTHEDTTKIWSYQGGIKITVFWDMIPFRLVDGNQHFGGTWFLHFQARRGQSKGNVLDLYSGGALFESRYGHRLFLLRFHGFLNLSRRLPRLDHKCFLSNHFHFSMNYLTLRCYTVSILKSSLYNPHPQIIHDVTYQKIAIFTVTAVST
jgi:hypothetical protein